MPIAPEYLHMVFPNETFYALLYGRASRDPKKRGDSVEDQLDEGRGLCDRFGWPVVEEFKDIGISATRHGREARDDFEDLLVAIEEGAGRIVVAYEASRYYRDLEAYVRLRNACCNSGVLLCYNNTVYDLSKPADRRATAQDAIAAEEEGEGIRNRNLRTARLTAEAGKPHGRLQYGFSRDYEVVNGRLRCARQYENPVGGPYVLKSFQHIDSSGNVTSLVKWLRSKKSAQRPDGAEWNRDLVRRMLLNRAYVGERYHKGAWVKATWAPIKGLDTPEGRAMFNRVVAKMMDPARRTQRDTEVAHLLSHNALCGECGDDALLVANKDVRGRSSIRCETNYDTTIREELIDAFVEEGVIAWFGEKHLARQALVGKKEDVSERMAAAQRLINGYEEQLMEARQLANSFDKETGRPKLSALSLASIEQSLLPQLEVQRKKLRDLTGVPPLVLDLLNAKDPEVAWNGRPATADEPGTPGLSLEQKRDVVRMVVTVRLYKARSRGVRRVEPGRITLSFLGTPGFRARPLRVRGPGRASGRGSG
ncbi:recombinase family protein [Streptomyces sp. PmtG]